MVRPFKFTHTPDIIFGAGKRKELDSVVKKFGQRVLFITGKKSFITSKYWFELKNLFERNHIIIYHFLIQNEPSPEVIDNISRQFEAEQIDAVVALGGGSVLDAGKAVSAMIGKKESVKDFLEGVGTLEPDGSKIPFVALPTTSGTGSECTKNAVISEIERNGFKKSLRHDNFVPNVAIIDPELTLTCPEDITAASGMDSFTQLLESYLSTNSNPLTDSLAFGGLEKIKASFEKVMENRRDLKAREDLAYASMISGITLANAGLGTIHGFASSIGGRFDIPHGVICGTLMGACNQLTIQKLKVNGDNKMALEKYAKVGKLFSGESYKSNDYYIDFLIDLIFYWTEKFNIPKLSEYGINQKTFSKIAENTGNKNNPVSLEKEELIEILESRF